MGRRRNRAKEDKEFSDKDFFASVVESKEMWYLVTHRGECVLMDSTPGDFILSLAAGGGQFSPARRRPGGGFEIKADHGKALWEMYPTMDACLKHRSIK